MQDTSILDRLRQGLCSSSAQETAAIAAELAAALPPDCTLALHGDLGCGKTTFVAGLAKGLGIAAPVTSPSYNLMSLHKGSERMLAHLDAYRLQSAADMDALMLEEFLHSPYCIALEWPERVQEWLPEGCIHLYLVDKGEGRRLIRIE